MALFDVSFDLGSSAPDQPLSVTVWFDHDQVLSVAPVPDVTNYRLTVDMPTGSHRLVWRMQGKTAMHTKLTQTGEIQHDCWLELCNIRLGGVAVDHLLAARDCYSHDFNGHGDPTVQPYHGVMGCNGDVILEFDTPLYMWFLQQRQLNI